MNKSNLNINSCLWLTLLIFITTIAATTLIGNARAITGNIADTSLYRQLNVMTSGELLSEARKCIHIDSLADRATIALTIVGNRYYHNQGDSSTRKDAMQAFYMLGNFYHTSPVDFRKAYRNLIAAKQIAEEDNNSYQLASIYLSLSNLYHNSDMYSQMSPKARQFLIKGMETGIKGGNLEAICVTALNMVTAAFNENSWGDFYPSIQMFRNYCKDKDFMNLDFYKDVIEACEAYLHKDYSSAIDILNSATLHDVIPALAISGDALRSVIYKEMGLHDKAMDSYRAIVSKSKAANIPVYEMNTYKDISDMYRQLGRSDSADTYYVRYLKLKDSLESNQGYGSVEKMEFLSEIDKINREVEQLSIREQQEKRRRIIYMFVLIIVLIVTTFITWIYLTLRKSHQNLYHINEDMMRKVEGLNMSRKQLEEEIKGLTEKLKASRASSDTDEASAGTSEKISDGNIHNDAAAIPVANEDIAGADEDDSPAASNETLVKVYSECLSVMDNSETIFRQGFSINELAHLVSSPPYLVSKAINVCRGTNFKQFLNEYRIREVTRLMHDPASSQLTIEAIALKAGFKSRPTFVNLFKSFTGLTPSAYMKMAEGNRKNTEKSNLPNTVASSVAL